MGWIARSQLASAVCNAGGFGVIETSSGEVDNCKAEIEKMSELTDQPLYLHQSKKVSSLNKDNTKLVGRALLIK